jgi:hypothetical protein
VEILKKSRPRISLRSNPGIMADANKKRNSNELH